METLKFNSLFVMAMLVASMNFHGMAAKQLFVGADLGWAEPSIFFFYTVWASNQDFRVNDVLYFRFATGNHTVAEVTKEAFDACDGTNPIQLYTSGPASVSINTPGDHYYMCTVGKHCRSGQRFLATVHPRADNSSSALPH